MRRAWKGRIGNKYVDRLDEVVAAIGSDQFTRRELVSKAGTGNFQACLTLCGVLARFRPRSIRDLSSRMDYHKLRGIEGIGDTAVFVWCSLLEAKGLSVNDWLDLDLKEEKEWKRKRKKR